MRQTERSLTDSHILHSSFYISSSNTTIENIHLQNNLPNLTVEMDEKILRQILINLITNAIKYSSKDSIINLEFIVDQEYATFIVSDQGIGIPEEDLGKLFSAFYRGKNVGILPGTGLGLSIVKNCVDIHNGSISVESQLNVGTKFTVVLPIASNIFVNL
jgi:signal transduction histidine kinase